MTTKFRTVYSDQKVVGLDCSESPSLTEQLYKDECDIGFIIENFVKTGQLPTTNMTYQDCTSVQDFESAQMLVADCKSNFEMLGSEDRERFHNSVSEYLEFVSNPQNLKESYDKGYIDRSTISYEDVVRFSSPSDDGKNNATNSDPIQPAEQPPQSDTNQ